MDGLNVPCFLVNAHANGGLKLLKRTHIAQYGIREKYCYRNIRKYIGDKEPKGLQIASILPRSANLYHELFHLVLSNKYTGRDL
jgi:hypothetical protein